MANQYRDRPFPADDDYSRDQSRMAQPQGESDPLAELARLIGQADPFSNFGREQQAQPARHEPRDQYAAHEPAAEEEDVPAVRPSWLQNLAAARQAPQEPAYREDSYREEPYREPERYDPPYADERHHQSQDHIYGQHAPQFDHSGYDPVLTGQGRGQQAASDRYDDVLYGRPDHDPGRDDFTAQGGHYDEGGYDRPPYGEDFEQEAPKARRGGMMTVVVVLLLAVVGTGAAFAYRTFVGSPRSGEPPVIRADAGPNKIIPPGAGDGSSKQITDRVGDKSPERVVSREEQPVDVNARTGPRVVFPPLTQNANPPSVASASTSARPTGAGVGNGTLTGGEEPRKIRTLSIRPDQPDSAAAAPAAPARAQPPAQRTSTTAPASTASTGAPSANAPVSLSPQAQPPAAPADRQKVAAISPAAVTGGGAYVQVSSQKSEADAKASFKSIQGKYASILGSRTATIHKAEIAGKGTFYRAMVGPFGTNEEAAAFCGNLKTAGGQCVVQRR
ncbi:MAG: SPOR domain-containing protein [Bradyrhizobiaceae bacterium]|nr:MAG: SPOR domain-containing protein [Bradyrhizobiaceae bacterium]